MYFVCIEKAVTIDEVNTSPIAKVEQTKAMTGWIIHNIKEYLHPIMHLFF